MTNEAFTMMDTKIDSAESAHDLLLHADDELADIEGYIKGWPGNRITVARAYIGIAMSKMHDNTDRQPSKPIAITPATSATQ